MNAAATTPTPLLRVRALNKRFGAFQALRGVDFELGAGEFLTLLGPSGSGKTTTLMSIAGFVAPTSGDILYQGASITGQAPEARGFGMVFQGYALFPHMTVEQNVRFPLAIRGVGREQARRRAQQALEQVQLGSYGARYPRQLSGGQQQRVALARALVYDPRILLLDEPLSALDKKLRADLQWELRKLNKESGASFLYVTHDQEEALSMSDRIAIFNEGGIAQIGSPTELYERPANLFVAGFLGRSNVLAGKVRQAGADGVAVEYEGGVLEVPKPRRQYAPGEAVSLVVRPHQMRLDAAGRQGLAAKVEAISYAGNLMNYLLRTPRGTALFAEAVAGAGAALRQDDLVSVGLDAAAVSLLEAAD
ncbi:ABC transporter ATP-binding protein [Bordetella parapertussis]|uniref:ABC transporter ATP-binding protein n=4 Tax=Bordetella TaxID=517 RepID=A0ABU5X5D3_BORPP|nr:MULTISPECIES: ABC transporter ATP-binding protein [Bordetella]KAK69168.1 ABC transporter, ATP-binding protein [Bordetella bronchiseptica 980-2]AMG88132.1 ABC transporter ATP-binding protein [Bordetella bronchiseptica]AOB39417.1 ABC transporter ATP-binding protein [Bordetella parapertussis]AUL43417.1 ABC transporter ATP-binding protein [Bordetella parapertussis]AWP63067.1 ABC transporter ATP-binding protein [Bordetella parapertussis]